MNDTLKTFVATVSKLIGAVVAGPVCFFFWPYLLAVLALIIIATALAHVKPTMHADTHHSYTQRNRNRNNSNNDDEDLIIGLLS